MKQILLSVGLAGCITLASAQPTLDECQRLAREHYPEIRQYELVQRTEHYDLSNAARAWLPQLSLAAQATWQTDVMALPDALTGMLGQQGVQVPGLNKDQYKIMLQANQTVWDGGKSKADRQLATAQAAEQHRLTDVDLYAVEARINDLYFGILLFDERLVQTHLTLTLLQSNLDKVRSLQAEGVAMPTDGDAVEAELLAVGQQRTQLEAARDSYRRMLEIFIGRPLNGKLKRPDGTEPATTESARPELDLYAARIRTLTAREQLVKAATQPKLGLFAQGYYGYPGLNYFESMLTSDWSWNALVGVKMSWNFGAYYTKKNDLQRLHVAQRQIEVQRDLFHFHTDLEVARENSDLQRLKKVIADDDRIVALRRCVREAAESKLRNGIIDTNDLLQKITEEATARSARSAREIELLKTIYELRHTLNR